MQVTGDRRRSVEAAPETVPSLAPVLTPHGRLVLSRSDDGTRLEQALAHRLVAAFERGAGHGLLQLGAGEVGISLPAVLGYWREFGARFVTALCGLEDAHGKARVPALSVVFPDCRGPRSKTIGFERKPWATSASRRSRLIRSTSAYFEH